MAKLTGVYLYFAYMTKKSAFTICISVQICLPYSDTIYTVYKDQKLWLLQYIYELYNLSSTREKLVVANIYSDITLSCLCLTGNVIAKKGFCTCTVHIVILHTNHTWIRPSLSSYP